MVRLACQFKRSLAFALPFIILWAWAGCILLCIDETASQENSAKISGAYASRHAPTSIESTCREKCVPVNPAAFAGRHNTGALAVDYEPLAVYNNSRSTSLPQTRTATIIPRPPPKKDLPLNTRPGNLRI